MTKPTRPQLESLEGRTLLSSGKPSPALVGSISGMEVGPADGSGIQIIESGNVKPLGNVTATGFLFFNRKTGAVNSHGTLTLSNSQGSLTLSIKSTKGFVPLFKINSEEIPVTVSVQSATGSFKGINVKGTVNLVNDIRPHRFGTPSVTLASAQFNLKPAR
jgi:hypothetical protein